MKNNMLSMLSDSGIGSKPFWWQYPCLVCGISSPSTKDGGSIDQLLSSAKSHKRCARCHSAVYCSSECQKHDYTEGKHKSSCVAL